MGGQTSPRNYQYLGSPQKGLYPKGRILGMRPAQALTVIQTMADHSQKWHDGTTSRNIESCSSKDELGALVNKLDNLGRDMKKLKESVHAIQVGCQICKEPHLDKDCLLNEEVKHVKEETSGINKLHGVSFISGPESNTPEVLQHQLPPKELNQGSFTLPCIIGKFNFYAMADLVENVLLKTDKFLFPSDFIILDNTPSETTILGRPFLATIHAEIDVFARKISLGINEDRISFDTMRKDHSYMNPSEKNFMVRPQSSGHSDNQIDYEESGNWDNRSPNLDDREPKKQKINLDENVPRAHFCNLIKQNIKEQTKIWPSYNSAFVNNPTHRSFDDYKWEYNLEIDKLADEYELRIGKKGHILDNIWEYCNQVHIKNDEWHNYEFENEECEEIGIKDKDYHPPEVQIETFEVKKYSFEGGQSFICVTKDLDNTLPLGRKNGSKFKEMIRKEVENNKT
ncbi:RNA-directed DNA polymerase, eukaryota, reverse transcriptase zinc-binding domain protein [Tanacetum coccineum]|uniref:RNA-directed DNA polymerase, eukaryota, reverse transcriptase zinc-binding domain protein n=1 Tax=Tanacetum coccineum TaxID=301880 RepID=A0ABQ5JCM3_9ASTR